MKISKNKLTKIIKKEIENVIYEFDIGKFQLKPLKGPMILKFNAGTARTATSPEVACTKFLKKTPFEFKEVWLGLRGEKSFLAPTPQELEIWEKVAKEYTRYFRSQGVAPQDMNVELPLVLLTSDVSKFPAGKWTTVQWNPNEKYPGKGLADALLEPRYNLPQRKEFQNKEKSKGGGSRWFNPVANKEGE